MIIIRKYREIVSLPDKLRRYYNRQFQFYHRKYGADIKLEEFDLMLAGVGVFAYIEKESDLFELSSVGLRGGLENQFIEFAKVVKIKTQHIHFVVLQNDEYGIDFVCPKKVLNSKYLLLLNAIIHESKEGVKWHR